MMCKDNSVYKDRDFFIEILNLICTLYPVLMSTHSIRRERRFGCMTAVIRRR